MAKKKFKIDLKVAYDAPVTLTFVIVSAIIFLLNILLAKSGKAGGLEKIFASPTSQAGVLPFIPSAPLSYVRLLFYIFGTFEINYKFLFSHKNIIAQIDLKRSINSSRLFTPIFA